MKRLLLIIIISAISSCETKACDICGCGVGSYYIGILPDFSKRIMGMRYRYNTLKTHLGPGGTASYLTTDELYHTLEIWGGVNVGRKFRLMASIPFNLNERKNLGATKEKDGPGDILLTGFYHLINSQKTIQQTKRLVQSLFLGGGLKLPTGKYNPADKQNTTDAANLFQLGTGSLDFILNTMYDLRLQDAGININASYKMNMGNKYNYNYGNKLSLNTQLYYKYRLKKKITLAPNAGVLFENAAKDIDRKFKADISGGKILCGSLGIETNYKKISAGMNWQTPLSQDLANGFVKARNRGMIHISFSF